MELELRPGLWLFLLLSAWLDPLHCFFPFLAACILHEAGHLAAIFLCGGSVRRIRLDFADAQIETGFLPARAEILCALAGPAVNLLCALSLRLLPEFAVLSLLLALCNLLPIRFSDGGRILYAGLSLHLQADTAERICEAVSILFCLLPAVFAVWAMLAWKTGLWPLLGALLLLIKHVKIRKSFDFP